MLEDIEGLIFIIALILLVLNVTMFVMMAMQLQLSYGASTDPAANCAIHEFPYIQWCKQQKFNDFMDKYYEWSMNRTK